MKSYKKLIRYAKPRYYLHRISILFIFAGALMVAVGFQNDWSNFICGILIVLLLGGGCMTAGIWQHRQFRKKLQSIEQSGRGESLLNDFENAGRAFSGSLILGDEFVIGKRTGNILTYGEIDRIYQFIPEHQERHRYLNVDTQSSRKLMLCSIPLGSMGDSELNSVIGYVTAKNPNIQVGFIG